MTSQWLGTTCLSGTGRRFAPKLTLMRDRKRFVVYEQPREQWMEIGQYGYRRYHWWRPTHVAARLRDHTHPRRRP